MNGSKKVECGKTVATGGEVGCLQQQSERKTVQASDNEAAPEVM